MKQDVNTGRRDEWSKALQKHGQLDRRAFLGATALGLGSTGLTAGKAVALQSEFSSPKPRLFELGTVTYNLGANLTLDQLIETCEKADFKAVELRTTHKHGVEPELNSEQRSAVRKRFERTPVRLLCLGSVCEYHSPDPAVVKENIALTGKFVELAADLGAKAVKVRPNGLPSEVPVEATLRQIGLALQEAGRQAEQYKVELWLEVHGRGTSHPPHTRTIMDVCSHPLVGLTWNCNDEDLKDGKLQPYFDQLKPHIRNVHLHELVDPYPFVELFSRLRDMGYAGYTLAEVPEVQGDTVRFMRHFRALWDAWSRPQG